MLCTNSRSPETFAHELQGRPNFAQLNSKAMTFCTESHGPGNFAHKPEPGDFAHRRHGPKILRTNSKDHEIVCTNFKSHEISRTTSMGSEFCPQTPRPLNILQGPLNIPCATSFCANTTRPTLCANSKRQVCVQFPRAPNCTHKLQAPSNFAHKLESPKSLH